MKQLLIVLSLSGMLFLMACQNSQDPNVDSLAKVAAGQTEFSGEETDIPVSDLPTAITDYVSQNYPNATITEAEQITTDAGMFYGVDLVENGQEIDLIFDADGVFVSQETDEDNDNEMEDEDEDNDDDGENEVEIDPADLPAAVRAAIEAQYPGAVLLEADEITQSDGSLTYDVEITFQHETFEVMYAADGTFLGVEDDHGDGDDEDNDHEFDGEEEGDN